MLSTPPAFILSQDQTLMLKSFSPPELIWQLIRNNVLIYCFKVASLTEAFLNYSQNLSRFFTVQLSRFFVLSLSATTSILYQMFNRLSTTFLIYFFAFIAIRIDFCRASRVSLVIISCSPTIVNNKFHFFAFSFFNKVIDLFWLLRYAECIFFLICI